MTWLKFKRYSDQRCWCRREDLGEENIASSSDRWPHQLGVQSLRDNAAIIWRLQRSQVALCRVHCSWVPEPKRFGNGSAMGCNSPFGVVMTVLQRVHSWRRQFQLWSECLEIQWWGPVAVVNHLFKCFKSQSAFIGEVPNCTLSVRHMRGTGDFRVSINEMSVEVGKPRNIECL